LSYSNQLSIALNATMSNGLLWIYQEDPESIFGYSRIPRQYSLVAWYVDWHGQYGQYDSSWMTFVVIHDWI